MNEPDFGNEEPKLKKHILLVDDSATMLMSLKSSLEIAGFEVSTAGDGVQALERIKARKPDLMVTDINMPRMDGLELIRQARTIMRFTPILTLTTESQQVKRDEARRNGASGWLVKPVAAAELIKVIRQVLPGA